MYALNRDGHWAFPVQFPVLPIYINLLHSGTDKVACFKVAFNTQSAHLGFYISYIFNELSNHDDWGFNIFSLGY